MTKFHNDKVSMILALAFLFLILISVLATWYNTMVLRNFVIIDDTEEEALIEETA